MRDHWRELGFWRWWWQNRVPFAVKSLVALLLLAGIVAGGWLAAQSLPSAQASDSSSQTIVRTLQRVVTTPGRVVVRRVSRVRTVYVSNHATAGTTVRVTKTVPGHVRTVVRTVAAPRAKSVTVTTPTRTRTVIHTVTKTKTTIVPTTTVQWRVITVVEKQKPVTVTVTVTAPAP
jgi:hypothetical protein